MKGVAEWINAYWALSWVIPTAIAAVWLGGALLFFGFAAAVRGIRSAWIALFRPEVRREREAHEVLLEELRNKEFARRHEAREPDDLEDESGHDDFEDEDDDEDEDEDDDDDVYDPDAVSPFWSTEQGAAILKKIHEDSGWPSVSED
ncbi:MAG: hypothetical protein WCI12_08055 [Actinomycetes bacterium]